MFKLLLLLISIPSICFANENKFYVKAIVSTSKLNNIKEFNQEANISPSIGIGMGYYINDTHRIDIMADPLIFHFHNEYNNYEDINIDSTLIGAKVIKRKASGRSLMVNNYIDILSTDNYKIFVGAGIGLVRFKEKVTYLVAGNCFMNGQIYTFPLIVENVTSKSTTNLAYSLAVGTSVSVNPEVHLDFTYRWKDFGKPKYNTEILEVLPIRNRYREHNFSFGIRFDL